MDVCVLLVARLDRVERCSDDDCVFSEICAIIITIFIFLPSFLCTLRACVTAHSQSASW